MSAGGGRIVEPGPAVLVDQTQPGGEQRRPAEHPHPAVIPQEQPLGLLVAELLRPVHQLIERPRRPDPGLPQQALAVIEQLHVHDLRDAPDLVLPDLRRQRGLMEVILDRLDDIGQIDHLPALDLLQQRPVDLEHIRPRVGQQRRRRLPVVIPRPPLHRDVRLPVGSGIPLHGPLGPRLPVLVIPLPDLRPRTAASAPGVGTARARQPRGESTPTAGRQQPPPADLCHATSPPAVVMFPTTLRTSPPCARHVPHDTSPVRLSRPHDTSLVRVSRPGYGRSPTVRSSMVPYGGDGCIAPVRDPWPEGPSWPNLVPRSAVRACPVLLRPARARPRGTIRG